MRIAWETGLVPEERLEERWILYDKKYCKEQEWKGKTRNGACSRFAAAVEVSLANSEPAAKDNVPLMSK